jgi:hypothetical protein
VLATSSPEITWVALDPGDSRYSPQHIEGLILDLAHKFSITIEWLATLHLTDGEARYGFVIAGLGDLTQLAHALIAELGEQAMIAPDDLIERVRDGREGRFLKFPSAISEFANHSADELISSTAIEAIYAVGEELPSDAIIATDNHLRPTITDGKIVLLVERLYTGDFAPIEKKNPHQCCAGEHAPF